MSREQFTKTMSMIVIPSIIDTLSIVGLTVLIGFISGFIIALILTLTKKDGLKPNEIIYNFLNIIVNTVRSFPGLILIVSVTPLTKLITGTTIGIFAAVVPLTLSCTCLSARLLEETFRSVETQLIEAAYAFGASNLQILFKVIVKESVPGIVSALTLVTINMIAMSTIAGTVGGGGVGAVALTYGYQSFNNVILYTCVFILFVLVQTTQFLGTYIHKKL